MSSDCSCALPVYNEGVFSGLQTQVIVLCLDASVAFPGLSNIIEPGLTVRDCAMEEVGQGNPHLAPIARTQRLGSFCIFPVSYTHLTLPTKRIV